MVLITVISGQLFLNRPGGNPGDPYSRPASTVSSSSDGAENAWRRRQAIKRGVTRKVQLTKGNFITEYPVPTPVFSAVEAKWATTKTSEFTYVDSYVVYFQF
jgi:chitin synthase